MDASDPRMRRPAFGRQIQPPRHPEHLGEVKPALAAATQPRRRVA